MDQRNYDVFLSMDASQYIGEWVAISEGRVVSRGENLKKVYEEAKKKYPNKKPLISKVPEKQTMIF